LLRVRTNVAAIAAHTGPGTDDPDAITGDQDSEGAVGAEDLDQDLVDELEDDRDWTETPANVGSR